MAGYQFAMDYRTPFTTTSLTLANVDLLSQSGKVERRKNRRNRWILFQVLLSYSI